MKHILEKYLFGSGLPSKTVEQLRQSDVSKHLTAIAPSRSAQRGMMEPQWLPPLKPMGISRRLRRGRMASIRRMCSTLLTCLEAC